jgi:hypothetical protein
MNLRRIHPKSLWEPGVVLLGAVALTFFFVKAIANSPLSSSPDAYPGPQPTGTSGPGQPSGMTCDAQFPNWEDLPIGSEKRTLAEEEYLACIEAWQSPIPIGDAKPTSIMPPISTEPAAIVQRVAGLGTIIESGLAPLPAMSYVIVNAWHTQTDNRYIHAYAGAERAEPGMGDGALQGAVVVVVETLDFQPVAGEGGQYAVPGATSPVRIIDAQENLLTLATSTGEGYYFDVASRQFVYPGPDGPVERTFDDSAIVESSVMPISLSDYSIENWWYQDVSDTRTIFAAGAEQQNPGQGIIVRIVTDVDTSLNVTEQTVYSVPVQFGTLRISEVNGTQLTLATRDGVPFVFDMVTRQFVGLPDIPPDLLTPEPTPLAATDPTATPAASVTLISPVPTPAATANP